MNPFKVSLCILICAFSCMAYGCGSEKGSPVSQEKERPATSDKPRVVEVLPRPHSDGVIPPRLSLQGQLEPGTTEVIPPEIPGGRGVTQAEVAALGSEALDPRTLEVIPPEIPGGRGVTQAEVDSLTGPQERVEPLPQELTPPEK